MFKDSLDVQLKHEEFIQDVCESEIVYALKSAEGYATSSSNEFEDEAGNTAGIICFWSAPALARACVRGPWLGYELEEIPLPEFIESWMVGMYNDEVLAGTNFDQNMFGHESEPLELALALIAELKRTRKTIAFLLYKSMEELEKQVADVWNDVAD